ncbi:type III-A CRISPR-associated protein Csm2 [Clostridium botulinum]|nr:type III-A CRISPR-associated protein Csm2 [Clostridium botulinum]NFB58725.1 type III-A CRISPR-associated protein Csm2 [Clostridium botulinum]QDY21484.1 type III-A CRISPR-associated protein Csm2 [Clostridium botulinum]
MGGVIVEKDYKTDKFREYEEYFKKNVLTLDKINYDQFIEKSKDYSRLLKNNGLTTSMIRKIYNEILKANEAIDLKRLRPILAYTYGRNRVKGLQSLFYTLDDLLKRLNLKTNYLEIENVKEFLEVIIAYMKFYGDRY